MIRKVMIYYPDSTVKCYEVDKTTNDGFDMVSKIYTSDDSNLIHILLLSGKLLAFNMPFICEYL